MKVLCLQTPVSKFTTPCFRSNLFYDVIFDDNIRNSFLHLKEFIDQCLNDTEFLKDDVNIKQVQKKNVI